jgi:predicted ATPase/Tfp pilus assembly protein PilF
MTRNRIAVTAASRRKPEATGHHPVASPTGAFDQSLQELHETPRNACGVIKARLFGGFHVEVAGQPILRFRTRKVELLLAYLLRYPQPHPRKKLLQLFWKGVPLDAARNNLRVTLSSLRAQLEPPGVPAHCVLLANRHTVALNPEFITTDVDQFEQLLLQASQTPDPHHKQHLLEQAAQLYQGDFLPDYDEPWVVAERQRLRQLYEELCQQLPAETTPPAPTYARYISTTAPPEGLGVVLGIEATAPLSTAQRAWAKQVILAQRGYVLEIGAMGLRAFFSGCRGLLKALASLRAQWDGCHFAVDVGEVLYQQGRYSGSPLRVVEQLLAVGSAGQLLCTERVAMLLEGVRGQEVPPFRLRHLGCYRLGERSEGVYQLDLAGWERDYPPLRAASPLMAVLPRVPTRFIGRDVELTQLLAGLEGGAGLWWTVVGAPGVGKSRLVLECGHRAEVLFGPARWWVRLHGVEDSVGESWARVLGWEWQGLEPFGQRLHALLGGQRGLLLLDTPVRLTTGQQREVRALLQQVSGLNVVMAAPAPCGCEEEQLFWLEPLPVPPEGVVEVEALWRYGAVRLFVDRAQRVCADFRLTQRNGVQVAQLCRWVEGLPLAIELVASRVGSRDLEALGAWLQGSCAWQRGRPVGALSGSLLASLQMSVEGLEAEAVRLLAYVSVFVGSFSEGGAQAVYGGSVSGLLEALVERSLVQRVGERYRLLEPVRQFSWARLQELGEVEPVRARHWAYYREMALRYGDKGGSWGLLEAERANIEAALAYAVVRAPVEALELGVALAPFWESCGSGERVYRLLCGLPERLAEVEARLQAARLAIGLAVRRGEMEEAGRLLERYLPEADAVGGLVAGRVWLVAGFYRWVQGDYGGSKAYLERAVEVFRGSGAWLDLAEGLLHLGVVLWMEGDLAGAQGVLEEVLELAPYETAPRLHLKALSNLANVLYQAGKRQQAEACIQVTLQRARERNDRRTVAISLNNWGVWLKEQGEYARARELCMQAHAIWQALPDCLGETAVLNNLADIAMQEGDYETAHQMFQRSLECALRYRIHWYLPSILQNIAELALRQGDWQQASRWQQARLYVSLLYEQERHVASTLEALAALRESLPVELPEAVWEQLQRDSAAIDREYLLAQLQPVAQALLEGS